MRQVVLGSHGCLWQQMNVRDARKRVSDADREGKKKKGYVMLAKHEQKVRFRMRIRCTLCIIVAKKLLGGVANRARRGRICPF